MLLIKKKDWVTPLDEVITGKEYSVELYNPVEEFEADTRNEWTHMFDGTFVWFTTSENKIIRVAFESLQYVTLLDGITKVKLKHVGNGVFEQE